MSKFDRSTHEEWEKTLKGANIPTLKQLSEFLTEKCQVPELMNIQSSADSSYNTNKTVNKLNRQRQSNLIEKQNFNSLTMLRPSCEKSPRINACPEI